MAYTFDQLFAADPSNPSIVASNGTVTLYAPGDGSKTPVTITDTTGVALPNPVTVNGWGYGPAFMHETLDRLAWDGGGFSGFLTSHEGLKDQAVAARDEATASATAADASAVSSAQSASLVGAPAGEAVRVAIAPGGAANGELSSTIAESVSPVEARVDEVAGRVNELGQRTSKLSMVPSAGILSALPTFRSKVAALRGGTGTLKVLCIGDSTTHGNDSTKAAGPWNNTSWPTQAAEVLTADGIRAQSGLGIAPSYSSVGIDGRWTLGSGWSQLTTADIGWGSGACVRTSNASTATGTAVFNPGITYDKIDIYYTVSSNASFQAVIDVVVDGAVLGQINTIAAATAGIGKLTLTPTAATISTVTLDSVSGAAIYVLGIDCYTASGVLRIGNAGVSGSATFSWKNDNGAYASLDCVRAYAPDLTIINLGINDSGWTPARAVAGVVADLTTLGTVCDASGDVILTSFIPSADNSDKDETVQPGYWAEIKALAASKGWGYIDIAARYEDYPTASERGWMSDLVHPNAAGYRNIAYAVADVIEAAYQDALL